MRNMLKNEGSLEGKKGEIALFGTFGRNFLH